MTRNEKSKNETKTSFIHPILSFCFQFDGEVITKKRIHLYISITIFSIHFFATIIFQPRGVHCQSKVDV